MARKNRKPNNNNNNNQQKSNNTNNNKANADKLDNDIDNLITRNEINPKDLDDTNIESVDSNNKTYKSVKDLFHKSLKVEKVLEKLKQDCERAKEKLNTKKRIRFRKR
ncbi:hypothetical protein PG910_08835 [Tenacibaculum dicentrarchi]|nr:hypothetical protein PG910_08835 [Tenacibaculum dicentrarchi]